jgi:hypothetical protein
MDEQAVRERNSPQVMAHRKGRHEAHVGRARAGQWAEPALTLLPAVAVEKGVWGVRLTHGMCEQENVESGPLSQLSWKNSVQFDSVRPGQHAWGWNWGWNVILRGLRVPDWIPLFGGCEAIGGGAPGYQIAYGITVECENDHGFPMDEMLLMDFSTEHLRDDNELEGGEQGHVPTFLYAFPFDSKTVFLQETHLVARNHRATCKSLEMEEMVRRLDRRISTLGLQVSRLFLHHGGAYRARRLRQPPSVLLGACWPKHVQRTCRASARLWQALDDVGLRGGR